MDFHFKINMPKPYKINCSCKHTYESPRGFLVGFVFTNLVA
jgi:hypothetical protein